MTVTTVGERVLRVDLTGSNMGPVHLSTEVRGGWPADWDDARLRQECADHYAIPVEQVAIVPSGTPLCCECDWHVIAGAGCRCE